MTFSWFPWQHERLNTTCDLLATTFSTVHRSTQTTNHAALPLARLDLSQSAKNWYDFTTQYYRYLSLSAFCFCLCFPITVEKKNPTNNKLQTGLIEEVARFHSNAGGWIKKAPRDRVLARDYFSDSWLVRFWQFLAYFSNKDYRNYETVLSETTRTKLGTRRLWISFFFLKLLNVDVYFHLWTRRTRKVQEKVHPRCTFSSPMPGQKACIKSLLIF